jgi:flagellar biosynthesis protein FlhA
MAQPEVAVTPIKLTFGKDMGFALGIITILSVLFLPIPAFLIDIGLAFSIAFSVLILMVALWIQKPLDFSSFPTILLIATMTRLSLNIATTRVILSDGNSGTEAAGNVIGGFSQLVMGGDFVIGVIVFLILVVVNFIVITKGATRIAEVGARFTLDAIPGKQMAIDADLSAGLISEQDAQARRKELEQESSFFWFHGWCIKICARRCDCRINHHWYQYLRRDYHWLCPPRHGSWSSGRCVCALVRW